MGGLAEKGRMPAEIVHNQMPGHPATGLSGFSVHPQFIETLQQAAAGFDVEMTKRKASASPAEERQGQGLH